MIDSYRQSYRITAVGLYLSHGQYVSLLLARASYRNWRNDLPMSSQDLDFRLLEAIHTHPVFLFLHPHCFPASSCIRLKECA